MTETIHSAALLACQQAARSKRETTFTFLGTEARAKPKSLPADVVEIWFWRRQFEQWQ